MTSGVPGVADISVNSISTKVDKATRIEGVLRTTKVYHDADGGASQDSIVTATFRVTDSTQYSVSTVKRGITLVVSLGSKVVESTNVGCGGSSSSSKGLCDISVSIPDEWFMAGGSISVSYRFADADANTLESLGQVTAVPAPNEVPNTAENTITAVYPTYDLYQGNQFDVTVKSLFDVYLGTLELDVEVDEALEITKVKIAQLESGKGDAFNSATNQPTKQKLKIVFAGRKEEGNAVKPKGKQPAATLETFVTLTFKVVSATSSAVPLTISLGKDGIADVSNNDRSRSKLHLIETRDGIVDSDAPMVNLAVDELVGVLPYAKQPAELLNTAVLSGKAVDVPIEVTGIMRRGSRRDVTDSCTCTVTSDSGKTLKVSGNSCAARLVGDEEHGSEEAKIDVKHPEFPARMVSFRIHFPVPSMTALTIMLSNNTLRSYTGYYDDDDKSCNSLKIQEAEVIATASFSDKVDFSNPKINEYDVSTLVQLQSTDNTIVAATGSTVKGMQMGSATISAKNTDATLAVVVADPSDISQRVGLVGLHTVLLNELGSITIVPSGPSLDRFQKVKVTVGSTPTPAVLQLQGDSVRVSVLAEFDDGSQLRLNEANGLVLASEAPESVSVSTTQQQITVVKDAKANNGSLVLATWQPGDECDDRLEHTQPIDVEVVPPAASGIVVSGVGTVADYFLVPVGDKAATAGFLTSATLSVKLAYDGRSSVSVNRDDTNLNFTVDDESILTVSKDGKITTNGEGNIGTAVITVGYNTESVTKDVSVRVIKFDKLEILAVAEPYYSQAAVNKLSVLACTVPKQSQKAKLKVTMVLTDPVETRDVSVDKHTTLTFEPDNVLDEGGLVLDRIAGSTAGIVSITAGYVDAVSIAWKMDVVDDEVKLRSVDNIRLVGGLGDGATISGAVGKTGRVEFGGTTDDGRKFIKASDLIQSNGVPVYSGMFSFASSNEDVIAVVDSAKGVYSLQANGAEAVDAKVLYC